MKILLVEPAFPIPKKSRNHSNFLPIGLLKIASYLINNHHEIRLVRGGPLDADSGKSLDDFVPSEIWITSLFTYWAGFVKDSVQAYRSLFPNSKIIVGGIYASLMPEHCKSFTGCDEVYSGVMEVAEDYFPAFNLINNYNTAKIDYQIIHASRGCNRKCSFCGTWKLEPEFKPKASIQDEIKYPKIVFYDNNFLANPNIDRILGELVDLKRAKRIVWCESQSGFDGRILVDNPSLALKIKQAGFRYPRIAWDGDFSEYPHIARQLSFLVDAGFAPKNIYVFMLYNWRVSFLEMEKKRRKCWEWGVQISDCRYRPLDLIDDGYNPKQPQENNAYFINPKWSDSMIKQFRRNIRRQNICVRQDVSFYSRNLERKYKSRDETRKIKKMNRKELSVVLDDAWFPGE